MKTHVQNYRSSSKVASIICEHITINSLKPFSESCEQNKQVILDVIRTEFQNCKTILEIGSGTGQHAAFFAEQLSHISWQTSDQSEYLSGILQWIKEANSTNVLPPLELDVAAQWPQKVYDGIFSANTAHIMGWPEVEMMFEGASKVLEQNASFCLYGPFNYNNEYTSPSNANFDVWLKNRDPKSAIRNFEDLKLLAEQNGLTLKDDHEMPANNRILVWIKQE